MIKEIGIKPALVRKAGWATSGISLCAILALIGVNKSHGSVHQEAGAVPLLTEKDVYTVQNSYLKKNEAPWLFDGERWAEGKILAIWNADTDANRAACANEWKESRTYRSLCMDLQGKRIISVDVAGLTTRVVTYVPVSRIAKVDVSDLHSDLSARVVRRRDISQSRTLHSPPGLARDTCVFAPDSRPPVAASSIRL